MGPTRFPYGQAHGFVNQFNYRGTTAGNITGSTAPNVTEGDLFYANNTDALTITNFILSDTGNRLAEYEGKAIKVFFLDTATRIDNAAPLVLAGTDNLRVGTASAGVSWLQLMHSRGTWYETGRSQPHRSTVSTLAINANSSANVDGVKLLILNNTGATTTALIALSGGQVGQEINVISQGSNVNVIKAGGNIFLAGTDGIAVNASGFVRLIKVSATAWRGLQVGSGAALA